MSTDMTVDEIGRTPFGKVAMRKLNEDGATAKNFRLFYMENLGNGVMLLKGAIFRRAKSGKNKGKLSVRVPRTTVTTYVCASEVEG